MESQPIFTRVLEKTTENSERLGRQARSGIVESEILRAEPLSHISDSEKKEKVFKIARALNS